MDDQQAVARAFLELVMQETGLDATNLARRAKVTPSTLTRFMNGEVKHSLSLRTLTKISETSGIRLPMGTAAPNRKTVPVVGYVGAGYRMFPFDDAPLGGGLEQVQAPPGSEVDLVAVIVRGASMMPAFWEGDLLFYTRDTAFDREECLYQECVVKVLDGPIYVKVIRPGRTTHTFDLESFNAPAIRDVEIEWAAPVLHINRTRRSPKAAMEGLSKPTKRRKA